MNKIFILLMLFISTSLKSENLNYDIVDCDKFFGFEFLKYSDDYYKFNPKYVFENKNLENYIALLSNVCVEKINDSINKSYNSLKKISFGDKKLFIGFKPYKYENIVLISRPFLVSFNQKYENMFNVSLFDKQEYYKINFFYSNNQNVVLYFRDKKQAEYLYYHYLDTFDWETHHDHTH